MRERVVVVLGAGNLRCGAQVLASLAVWKPDDMVAIRLWDTNEERLDLFDRFLRECLDQANTEHNVRASSDVAEELKGATDVIFTVHEDCARRLVGKVEAASLFVPEAPASLEDQVRGDPNKPSHPETLSRHTHTILSSPRDEGVSRETALAHSLSLLVEATPEDARILSLQRDIDLPIQRQHVALVWPDPIPDTQRHVVPHQILRWIHGEESLKHLLMGASSSPVSLWLNGQL